ncbi:hypothetical protein GUJ93_ZPchr0002g23416 [Zizania palustris]|uniref:J domain-containing protein n=1 Tax=Zizania palustris TaxID=103762 RepID=A0A8J5SAZ5_ZIZPA|nr:hypothetical protein GUJ93_ZPchr0002g23416 [Zizania palustris]
MDGASEKLPHKDYYKVLEVDYDASDDIIKLSYRRLALRWHPDKHKGDNDVTAKFQDINEAYTVLSDPAKRLEYDLSGCYELNGYSLRVRLSSVIVPPHSWACFVLNFAVFSILGVPYKI